MSGAICLWLMLLAVPSCHAESVEGINLLQRTSAVDKTFAPDSDEAHAEAEVAKDEPKGLLDLLQYHLMGGRKSKADIGKQEPKKNETQAGVSADEPKKEAAAAEEAQEGNQSAAQPPACVTRQDPRAQAWWSLTAKPGTPCVFGADDRDEGKHCIPGIEFGTMGWCWTKKDRSEWGSCSDGCPLYGAHHVISKKIEGVSKKIDVVASHLTDANKTEAPEQESAAPTQDANKTEAPEKAAASSKTNATAANDTKPAALIASGGRGATSLLQEAAQRGQSTATAQIKAAKASTKHAEKQTKLWVRIAERLLETDSLLENEDSLPAAEEAMRKARAWEKVASRFSAQVVALLQATTP